MKALPITAIDAFTWSYIDTVRRELNDEWAIETQIEATQKNVALIPALERRGYITSWSPKNSNGSL